MENSSSPVCRQFSLGHFEGLVQDCRISIANAMEILQSYTKP